MLGSWKCDREFDRKDLDELPSVAETNLPFQSLMKGYQRRHRSNERGENLDSIRLFRLVRA
jgi:hypothetical protein